jgi:hypothetical protein
MSRFSGASHLFTYRIGWKVSACVEVRSSPCLGSRALILLGRIGLAELIVMAITQS